MHKIISREMSFFAFIPLFNRGSHKKLYLLLFPQMQKHKLIAKKCLKIRRVASPQVRRSRRRENADRQG
jgi:hypothetical protein